MSKKIRKFVEKHKVEIAAVGSVVSYIVIKQAVQIYRESKHEYDILELKVGKGNKNEGLDSVENRMKSGRLIRYIGETGDYEFMIRRKDHGTFFEHRNKNEEANL